MSKSQIERKLRTAVEHSAPDIRSKVIENCKSGNYNGQPVIIRNVHRRKREMLYAFVAVAAMLLLVCNVTLTMASSWGENKAVTVIDIDVNPSIELKVNSSDHVVGVRAINQDAVAILDGMELNGTQTKVAVNAIVGSMVKHGYLQGNTDSILVSVNNKDVQVSEKIRTDITEDIDELMKAYSRDVSVIGQTIVDDPELTHISDSFSISEGKAALIRKIVAFTDVYTEEELALLNISELNEIICSMEEMQQNNNDTSSDVIDNSQPQPEIVQDEDVTSDENDSDETSEEDMSVSDNSVIDQAVSENTVSENDIDDETVSENSVSDNEVPESEEDEDTVSENSISENGIIGDAMIVVN